MQDIVTNGDRPSVAKFDSLKTALQVYQRTLSDGSILSDFLQNDSHNSQFKKTPAMI